MRAPHSTSRDHCGQGGFSRYCRTPPGGSTYSIASLAKQLSEISDAGKQVVLVSSGAVASGVGKLGLEKRPSDLAELQAVAAVGQANDSSLRRSWLSWENTPRKFC